MSCNCYEDVKRRVLDRLKDKGIPDRATEPSIELEGYTFGISQTNNNLFHCAAHQAVIRYQEPNKKGGMKNTVKKILVMAAFCPFCGKKNKKGGDS